MQDGTEALESKFEYEVAFSRNLGWLTGTEAAVLRSKRVAIAGLGGVGGHYCEVLARLGVGCFNIADFDRFGIENMNRQAGAAMDTLGQLKSDVMRQRILAINPEAEIRVFAEGVSEANMNLFLKDVDFYIDGLDFFVLDLRFKLFGELERRHIPYVTIAPLGMSASMVFFDSESMGYRRYFGIRPGLTSEEAAIRFLVGVAPNSKHASYLVDPGRLNIRAQKAPSTPMGCYLCAGIAGTIVLKKLLGRGQIVRAPWSMQFDAYTNTLKLTRLRFGGYGPFQILRRYWLRRFIARSR